MSMIWISFYKFQMTKLLSGNLLTKRNRRKLGRVERREIICMCACMFASFFFYQILDCIIFLAFYFFLLSGLLGVVSSELCPVCLQEQYSLGKITFSISLWHCGYIFISLGEWVIWQFRFILWVWSLQIVFFWIKFFVNSYLSSSTPVSNLPLSWAGFYFISHFVIKLPILSPTTFCWDRSGTS